MIVAEATGEIDRDFIGPATLAALQLRDGEVLLQASAASTRTHYFDGTELVAYSEGQRAAKAARPDGPEWAWSNASMSWEGVA